MDEREKLLVRRPFGIEIAWRSNSDNRITFRPLAGQLRYIVWGNCSKPLIAGAFAERFHAELLCVFLRYLQEVQRPSEYVAFLVTDLEELDSL